MIYRAKKFRLPRKIKKAIKRMGRNTETWKGITIPSEMVKWSFLENIKGSIRTTSIAQICEFRDRKEGDPDRGFIIRRKGENNQ